MAIVASAYSLPLHHLPMDPPGKAAASPGQHQHHPSAMGSSSLFSQSELQALDGFFNHHMQPQSRPSASSSSSVPRLPPANSYYPSNPLGVPSTSLHGRPSSSSSVSSHDETPQARERRLKSQTDDLAGWLSKYERPGQRVVEPSLPNDFQSSPRHNYGNFSSSSSAIPPRAPIPVAQSAASSASSGSDTIQPTTPAHYQSIGSTTNGAQPLLHYRSSAKHNADEGRGDEVDSKDAQPPPAKKQKRSPASTASTAQTSEVASAAWAAKGKGKGRAPGASSSAKAPSAAAKAKPKGASTTTTAARRASIAKAPLPIPTTAPSVAELPAAAAPVASTSTTTSTTITDPSSVPVIPKVVLTEEQKRANHIASEQKRRTAIRSAYDELCNVVPSLRAAVQEYEERLTKVHGAQGGKKGGGNGGMEVDTVAGVLTGGIDVGGEKVDGRAGPKSEAVVLGKTVEYLKDLLEEREELLARYAELLASAGRAPATSVPWNRRWSTMQRQ